jgi:2-oxo-3-hexenedioate decarboxylase
MNPDDIANEIFAILDTGGQIAPFSQREPGFDLPAAYRAAARLRALRAARGERPIGRKIGFTNRTIWAEYDVWAPIWGHVYDSTVRELAQLADGCALAGLAEPRIEPEIMFGLARAPQPDMDETALLACIEWVAHGFEIVQSVFPGWRFAAPDTVAAMALHGRLAVGPRLPVAPRFDDWRTALSRFEIDLLHDGAVVDHGRASNVLDGPLSALRHLVQELARDPAQPPLAAGEIVSTGTLTRALPVAAGQRWSTQLHGLDLPGARLHFV